MELNAGFRLRLGFLFGICSSRRVFRFVPPAGAMEHAGYASFRLRLAW